MPRVNTAAHVFGIIMEGMRGSLFLLLGLVVGCHGSPEHAAPRALDNAPRLGGASDDHRDGDGDNDNAPDGDDDCDPILEYRFEEGSGSVAANTGSFPGADGVRAGPAFSTDVPAGVSSTYSMLFDGSHVSVAVPDDFDLTADGTSGGPRLEALTIEAWIRLDESDGQRVIWDDYGNPGALLAIWDGRVQFGVSTTEHPGMGVAFYAGEVSVGAWHHVAGVYDGRSLRIRIDGLDTCARVWTTGELQDNSWTHPTIASIGIGADNESVPPVLNFAGAIDELRLWKTAVSVERESDHCDDVW